ncbi:uncharacterized protein [Bemisia tabaci]|uniref:uncharacterized protein n=1 Tax=Bemisia tabaci TaxID=7038 RepID=UPI003B280024
MTKVSGKSVTVHLRVDSGSFVIKPLPKFLRRKLQLHVNDSKENLDALKKNLDNESAISKEKNSELQTYMPEYCKNDPPIPVHGSPSFSSLTTTPEKATSENLDTVNNESDNESVISEGKIPEIQKYMKDFGVDDSPIPVHDSPSFSSPTTTPEKATSENWSEYERTINENFKLLNEARPVLRAYNNKLSIAGATILTSSSVEELYPDVSMEGAIIDYTTEKILGKKCMEDIENMVKCLGDMPNHKNLDTLKNDSDTESAISKGGIPEIQTYMPEDDPPIPFQNFHSCNSLSTAAEKLNFVGDNTKDALRTDSMKQNDREDSKETTLLLPVLSGDSKVYDFHENSNGTIFEYGDIINNCNTNFTSPLVISLDRSGNSTVCKLSQLDVAKNLFTSPSEVNDESTCINSVSTKTASLKDGSNSSESEEESTNLLSALTAEFNAVTKTMCPNNGTNVLTGTASVGISSALDVSFITVPVNPEEHILSNTPEECAEIDSNHENFQEIDGNDIAGEIQLNYCQSSHTDKRVWDKKAACLFCFQLYSKLSQHLLSKHGSEKEVQAYKNAEVKSYEKTRIISKLTKLGNYAHNMRVLKNGKGTIIVCRRPVYLTHFTDYLPCHACYGFYLRSKLWKHYMSCPEKIEQTNPTEKKVQRLGSLLMPCKEKDVTAAITELFSGMLADEVTHVIRSDPLLVKFATKKFNKHIGQPHMKNVIRQNLRVLGNLLIFLKKEEGITSISECLNTKNFFKVRSGVYNYFMSGDKSSPSSAIKSGHFLKKCAKIGVTDAIVSNDRVKRQSLEDFLFLYENDWHDYIDTPCNHILAERKFNKPEDLPLADDIIKFNQIVLQYEKKVLEDNFKNVNYRQLQENTFVHMIVFNRRRPGESERLQVTQFLERSVSSRPQGEVEKILCAAERSTASKLTRIKTFGKKRRGVAILLTEDMCKCIDYIVKNKEKPMKKEDENPYIFGIAGTQSHIRACDVIRKLCSELLSNNLTHKKLTSY